MMDSVRYSSYHQWRARKDEGVKPLQYHEKLLVNVEILQDNVTAIDRHIKDYLDVTKSFCGAGSHLAEAFCLVLKDTPLSEITQQLKQVVEEIDHVAHKSSLHILNHILGTLCEFTATFPDLKRAIEAHKRSAQNYESCQENLEALDRDETLCENSKRFKIAKKRFRSADEELSTEEENLYRSFTEVEENRVKMLGSCFLSLLQIQSQFLTSSSELMSPVGSFQEIGDYLRDREVTLALKDATTAWLSLAQANQGLRQGKGLTRYDVHLLVDQDLSESEKKQLAIRVELLLKNYQKEFERAPTPEADIPGGFQKHPKGIELALKGCCSETEAIAAGGLLDLITKEEMEAELVRHLPKLQLKIGSVVHDTCASPSKAPDNLKSKLHCIRELVNNVATHNDIPMNKENLDQFVTTILYEACSPVCMSSSKTAVQLLFGRANLVTIKPCKEANTRQARVFVKSTIVHVEVLSTWSITADETLFACLSHDVDLSTVLGTVDCIRVAKFSLMDFLEDKERLLPTIYIKRHNIPQSPSTLPKQESSPSHKQNRFRKSLTKATSKIFSRKSSQGPKQPGNTGNQSPTSSPPSAGTSSGSPGTDGNRISLVTSSTEASNDFETEELENFAPLPPPRPKHWARKVRLQNMGEVDKIAPLQAEKAASPEKKEDWYSADSKFPPAMFKPTLSDSQSQLSVASQQELDEVIKFLSGTPFPRRKSAATDNVDNSSHVTPADSGIGSTFSISLNTVNQHNTTDSSDLTIPAITTSTPPVDSVKETKKESKSRKGKNKQDSDSKKENNKSESTKGKKANKKSEKSSNKSQDSGNKSEVQSKEKQSSGKGVNSSNEDTSKMESKPKGKVKEQKNFEERENKTCEPSPVVVTVSSVDDDLHNEQDKVTISESLRSVWENAEPSKTQKDNGVGSLKLRKEKYGSQETLYHSCWSLSEFNDKGHKDEDTRSLNENMLPSNASPVMDLGLKWSIGFANSDVWGSNPNVSETNETETGQWCRSDESLDRTNHGGKSAFSLGLGITGPELFAAASQAGRDEMVQGLSVPEMNKPWSTEDLTRKDPWPRSNASPSPQPQWSKTSSLTDETQRQNLQRQALPPQHYSDPFLPQEHWWSQIGVPHPSHPRYQQYLQRQYSVDVNFQGMQGNSRGGYSQMGLSAFQPVPRGFQKPTRPAHLQVPAAYPNGNGNHNNHHASNPRF